MKQQTILQINSNGRFKGSITRQLSNLLVQQLKAKHTELNLINRELATGLPFIDEQWIGANFTAPEKRNHSHKEILSFSDELVNELKQSKYIVIAAPIYNFSIPAVLKAWIDLVARTALTFRYTNNGPEGLLENKKAFIVIASGGVPIGSEMDFASTYLKQVLAFIGITDTTIIDASTINLSEEKNQEPATKQIKRLTMA